MRIRQASPADAEKVLAIDEKVIGGQRRRDLLVRSIHAGHCFVATDDSDIYGFAIDSTSFFGQNFIELLIVHPEYQRKGVGRELLKFIQERHSNEKVFTSTNQSNVAMQNLCESLGFKRSGMIENLDEGDPEIIYFKHVSGSA